MNNADNPSKGDKIWDTVFNILGLIFAFAGFVAALFVGVFLAAASVYTAFKSFTFDSGAKVAAGFFFGLLMLGASITMAYADIVIVKAVADKFIRGDAGNKNAAESCAKDASENSIKEDTDKQ